MRTGALIHAILGRSCHTYWADSMAGGPGIADTDFWSFWICASLTTFFDFSDVTLAFEDKIKDWPNGWKCNLCDNIFNSDHRYSAHRDRSHRGRYRTVWYSMIKSIDLFSSFFNAIKSPPYYIIWSLIALSFIHKFIKAIQLKTDNLLLPHLYRFNKG